VPTAHTAFVDFFANGPVGVATPISSVTEFEGIFGGLDERSEASYQIGQFFLNGGQSAYVVRVAPDIERASALIGALGVLDPKPNLLSIPAPQTLSVVQAAQAWCGIHGCFYLVDLPDNPASPALMASWLAANSTLNSPGAALAWPRILIADPLNENLPRESASSGTIAGIYAANDAARGVWDAPAGLHAPLACAGLAYTMTDAENAMLTQRGINAIRRFPTHGIVLWGARTLSPDTLYVPVKRTELFIESSLVAGLQWTVFEPNNETLWSQVGFSVEAFLNGLWREGALLGSTERDAYFVRCDATTMTQQQIDAGELVCLVGVALVRPAEFVLIRIGAMAGPE
jgi:phage tail sheath protein FI